jgi:hypothetical protein
MMKLKAKESLSDTATLPLMGFVIEFRLSRAPISKAVEGSATRMIDALVSLPSIQWHYTPD